MSESEDLKYILDFLSGEDKEKLRKVLGFAEDRIANQTEPVLVREIEPIERWVENPYFVGKDGMRLYKFWKDALIDIFGTHKGQYNEIIIEGGLGCRPLDSFINTSIGKVSYRYLLSLPKEELKNISVLTEMGKAPIVGVESVGKKRTIQISFDDGYCFICTENHKIRIYDPKTQTIFWKEAKDITKSDCIIRSFRVDNVLYKRREPEMNLYYNDLYYMYGVVLCSKLLCSVVTNFVETISTTLSKDNIILEKIKNTLDRLNIKYYYIEAKNELRYADERLVSFAKESNMRVNRETSFDATLIKDGKFPLLEKCSVSNMRAFVCGLIDVNAVCERKEYPKISFFSQTLARQVQAICASIGLPAYFYRTILNDRLYKLRMRTYSYKDLENVNKFGFRAFVGFSDYMALDALNNSSLYNISNTEFLACTRRRLDNINHCKLEGLYDIPISLKTEGFNVNNLLRQSIKRNKFRLNKVQRSMVERDYIIVPYLKNLFSKKRVNESFGNDILDYIYDNNCVVMRCNCVTKSYEQECADITVLGSPTYINDGIINHNCGKSCLNKDTRISTSLGLLTLEELFDRFYNKHQEFYVLSEKGYKKCIGVYDNGIDDTYKIKFESGFEIEGTGNHKFKKISDNNTIDWVEFKNIKIGDQLLKSNNKLPFGKLSIKEDISFLLGILNGNGRIDPIFDNIVIETNRDSLICKLINKIIIKNSELFKNRVQIRISARPYFITYLFDIQLLKEIISKQIINYYNEKQIQIDLYNININKLFGFIWECNLETITYFLSGIFLSNVCIENKNLIFYKGNDLICKEISFLLNQIGVDVSIEKYNNYSDTFNLFDYNEPLDISYYYNNNDNNDHSSDLEQIYIDVSNEFNCEEINRENDNYNNINNDIDNELYCINIKKYFDLISLKGKIKFPDGLDEFIMEFNYYINLIDEPIENIEHSALYIKKYRDMMLDYTIRCQQGMYFDTVKEISYGKCHTYDLTIIDSPTYCVNRFVSHNTVGMYILIRKLYEISCYKNIPALFGLMTTANIVFMYFSLTKQQAEITGYAQFRTTIDSIPYFQECFCRDTHFNSMLKFPENVIFRHGASCTDQIGSNLIATIMDEANFFNSSGAASTDANAISAIQTLHTSVLNRGASRFMSNGVNSSISVLISSPTYSSSYTQQRIEASIGNPHAKVYRCRLWDCKPDKYSKEVFYVFLGNEKIDPFLINDVIDLNAALEGEMCEPYTGTSLKEGIAKMPPRMRGKIDAIPMEFRDKFEQNLIQSIMDIAGYSVAPTGRLFSSRKIWNTCITDEIPQVFYKNQFKIETENNSESNYIEYYLNKNVKFIDNKKKHFIHIDQSIAHDSTGFAMCHKGTPIEQNGSIMPTIILDFCLRITPPPAPRKIDIARVRAFIFYLIKTLKINIGKVTYDTFACLTSDMEILTVDGYFPIHRLKEGDKVITKNGIHSINKIFKYRNAPILKLKTKDGIIIKGTPNHKLFVLSSYFSKSIIIEKRLDELKKNDILLGVKKIHYVASVEEMECDDVYDIEVDNEHAYYVNDIYSHNSAESLQNLVSNGINAEAQSVDRTDKAYLNFIDLLYDGRVKFNKLDSDLMSTEIFELVHYRERGKVDHQPDGCFEGNTKIFVIGEGEVAIKNLVGRTDVKTFGYDLEKKEFIEINIEKIWLVKSEYKISKVRILNEQTGEIDVVVCTQNHKFLLNNNDYKEASSLHVGDRLKSLTGEYSIASVICYRLSNNIDVYDMCSPKTHNYMLGNGIIVHNSKDVMDAVVGCIYTAVKDESGDEALIDDLAVGLKANFDVDNEDVFSESELYSDYDFSYKLLDSE